MQPTLRRSGEAVYGEYLVVDRMGRLQLPEGYPEQVGMQRLASADVEGNQITIAPAGAESTVSTDRSHGDPDLREDQTQREDAVSDTPASVNDGGDDEEITRTPG